MMLLHVLLLLLVPVVDGQVTGLPLYVAWSCSTTFTPAPEEECDRLFSSNGIDPASATSDCDCFAFCNGDNVDCLAYDETGEYQCSSLDLVKTCRIDPEEEEEEGIALGDTTLGSLTITASQNSTAGNVTFSNSTSAAVVQKQAAHLVAVTVVMIVGIWTMALPF
ncbi:expressed unknown protein [Seminavis robusta]|uniref:Acidic protein n=1 Tax=Seminavis robusta TaxID=568900 RepID=A0A9N8EME1_9STRA|nr:expressed unknown protein [Seminavis robusta]|eukprot:Sro1173_g248980.1 n/a (165) ;mRNA; r:23625-24218